MPSLQSRSAQSWRLQSQSKLVTSLGSIHLSPSKPSLMQKAKLLGIKACITGGGTEDSKLEIEEPIPSPHV